MTLKYPHEELEEVNKWACCSEPSRRVCAEWEVRKLRAEVERLQALMREAINDHHGKAVLFSTRFLEAAGEEPPR